ncbi:AMP-binding enzyme [Micromonospora zamorensis]|uniref:AMP-binding enzyme n=1 Tax=Micromonospora zamorensis TaxID=709883 RepID=UPI00379E3DA2
MDRRWHTGESRSWDFRSAAPLEPAVAARFAEATGHQVLTGHRGVAESAVPGVPHPRTGETVRAYVVPAPAALGDRQGK